ncbi:hypothetical protein [Natronoglycomyces albus]|uniref:Uncharacterized protein n=1 Tax=Natronoglycomyces albus TaxID=2811108 RepID=A0A895XNE6_9ACTN|nr:hypothetical protein [Natronoglycomyces albus]QSB05063.1 hypothetical protein JQS30_15090 [Natronoglycomyces albus]
MKRIVAKLRSLSSFHQAIVASTVTLVGVVALAVIFEALSIALIALALLGAQVAVQLVWLHSAVRAEFTSAKYVSTTNRLSRLENLQHTTLAAIESQRREIAQAELARSKNG